jgi:hypothetical protein
MCRWPNVGLDSTTIEEVRIVAKWGRFQRIARVCADLRGAIRAALRALLKDQAAGKASAHRDGGCGLTGTLPGIGTQTYTFREASRADEDLR